MISEPSLEDRTAQPYVAIRHKVTMQDLGSVIDKTFPELFAWLGARGVPPAGAPFVRYLVINMADKMQIELGVPVATEPSVEGPVTAGILPPGRYASLIYTGPYDGLMGANAALLEWGAKQPLKWDSWSTPEGDAFGARLECYLTDPRAEPDPSQWKTEVAIRVADDRPAA